MSAEEFFTIDFSAPALTHFDNYSVYSTYLNLTVPTALVHSSTVFTFWFLVNDTV